jgi:manganese transport protein
MSVGSVLDRVRGGFDDMGPSWLAGAIAAGPATVASLITAGAAFGYTLLWVVVLSAILGTLTQYLAMRLGLLTEHGIVGVVENNLGERWAWLLVADAVLAAGLAQLVIVKTVAGASAALTGIDARVWGLVWAIVLAVGLAGGGYRFAELGAKVLVTGIVVVFIASLFVVPVDVGAAARGLIPSIPGTVGGVSGPLVIAGIIGGAVHITLVTMHSYTMRARNWTSENYGVATLDVVTSMGVAFGIYSIAIFLVAASVLSDPAAGAIEAGRALFPIAGEFGVTLFLFGLLGAAVSTLGGNTIVPPYLIADKLGWETDVDDVRYRILLAATALLSGLGVFISGEFFPLLVFVLAFGLIGTPFAIALVLYLLNDPDAVPETNGAVTNLAGGVLLAITVVVNLVLLKQRVGHADSVTDYVVIGFAAVIGIATAMIVLKLLRVALYPPAVRATYDN